MRKPSSLSIFIAFCVIFLFIVSCCRGTDCDPTPYENTSSSAKGIYILNEGLFHMNNASITYYDLQKQTLTADIFSTVNHRALGDLANDLICYGSKLYCVVNGSENIEIMNVTDCKSIKQLNCTGKSPRRLACYNGKIYVSCYNGEILRLDTISLEFESSWTAGRNPEGICVCKNKLYVANSGGLDGLKYDNTVSVFDLNTNTKLNDISVNINPYCLETNGEYVYIISRGNYDEILYSLQRIDGQTVKTYPDIHPFNISINGNDAMLYSYDYITHVSWIKRFDCQTDKVDSQEFITDATSISQPYSIGFHSASGDVYITDSYNNMVNGDVFCFDKIGKKKFSFAVGINPSKIVIIQ
jgi:hypothetical protein